MGDCQPPGMDDIGVEGPEYTCDWFTCGLCGVRTSSIENYVSHMVLQERCVLHLHPSAAVRDLLLPRFSKGRKKRRKSLGEEEEEELIEDMKLVKKTGGGGGGEEEDKEEEKEEEAKMEVETEEVEIGDGKRWKCRICGLTFSRQAAILNHFKLQHRVGGRGGEGREDPRAALVKEEEAAAPVKHIIMVEMKEEVEARLGETQPVKSWKELGCRICGQVFKTGKTLRAHMGVVHSERRAFHCNFQGCSFSFKTKGSLKRHQRRHTGERPFACQRCGRCFRESGSLTRHQQSQGSCVTKPDIHLPLYGRTLPFTPLHADRKVLEGRSPPLPSCRHSPPAHPGTLDENKALLRCQIAGNHIVKMEESGGQPNHSLSVCKTEPPPPPPSTSPPPSSPLDRTDVGEGAVEEDVKPPHLLPDILRRSFTCPVCLKSYSRQPSLALHIKQHLDDLGDQCSECQCHFATRQALGRHLSAHSSLRQFECQICGKTFKLLGHARAHLTAHSTAKTVPCRYCPNVYKTKSARNAHERTHTSGAVFPCPECQRAFTTKASLLRHLRTHTGEAPFSCKYCGRSFKEHGTLSRHLRHKVPCCGQARLNKEQGDTGIHLAPSSTTATIKAEGHTPTTHHDVTLSENDLVSEAGSSGSREREEGEGEGRDTQERFLLVQEDPNTLDSSFCLRLDATTPGTSLDRRDQTISL
ncbi:transcription factor E4F1-like [Portunus trituberculatus]|uniref:transcription factor E4F1-like n=1 Tax=Portunus trituberculatus TaxID=210409 RepID=UPI001E1CBA9E|nr:transcription factor E4F1-like [Portunus trituberculatus]